VAHAALTKLGACGAAIVLAACAPSGPVAPQAPRHVAPSDSGSALADRDWGIVESQRFLLAVPVPDAAAWRVDDRSGLWLVATHAASRSTLLVRSWREGSIVDHYGCEREARLWRPDLLGRDDADLGGRRRLDRPARFDTEVGFQVRRDGTGLRAIAAALGANVRRCVALVFITRVEGPDAEREAAGRLVFATTRILARVESR